MRFVCPSCKNKLTNTNRIKIISGGKTDTVHAYAVCTNCGARARVEVEIVLISDAPGDIAIKEEEIKPCNQLDLIDYCEAQKAGNG